MLLQVIEENAAGLLESSAFQELMIIIEDQIIFQSFDNEIRLLQVDSLLTSRHGLQSGNTREVRISEIDYLAFIYNATVHGDDGQVPF